MTMPTGTPTVPRRKMSAKIAEHLQAHQPHPVGRGQAPNPRTYPHLTLYSIDGGEASGPPLTQAYVDADLVYQINGVGVTDDSAEAALDLARSVMLTIPILAPDGWRVVQVRPDSFGGTSYSGQPSNRIYTASERYVISVTPG